MKVTICCINSKYVHSSLAPWYLAAAMERCAFCQTRLVEGTINQPVEQIVEKVLAQTPDAAAFCCYIWNIETVRQAVTEIKQKRPGCTIVLGGPEVSFCAEKILRDWPQVSYVLCGEGEENFPALMQCLAKGSSPAHIPGLARRGAGNRVSVNAPEPLKNPPPSPYTKEYLASLQGRIAYLETSRGCPFSCSFCLSGVKEKVRFFDWETSKQNLLLLANSGAKTVKFIDRTFNCRADRAYDWIAFLIENAGKAFPADVCFHFEVAADLFDERTLALLATAPAGLIQMEAGLQSFDEKTLEAVDRKTDIEKLTANLKKIIAPHNVHLHIDLIAGLPYEEYKTFGGSFNRAFALRPHMLQLGFLKMLHGSKVRRQAETLPEMQYCFGEHPPYEVQSNRWIGREELAKLHEVEDALERMYNSGRFLCTLEYVLQATGWDAFSLFECFGTYAKQQGAAAGTGLDAYTLWIKCFFEKAPGVEAGRLRDCLVTDRLSCDNTGRIPPFLRIEDKRLKKAKRQARIKLEAQGKIGVVLLYDPLRVAAFDYAQKDVITGRYAMQIFDLEENDEPTGTGQKRD